jgi:hypothetical protein
MATPSKEPSLLEVYDRLFPSKGVGSQPTSELCRSFGEILRPITITPLDVIAIREEVGQ